MIVFKKKLFRFGVLKAAMVSVLSIYSLSESETALKSGNPVTSHISNVTIYPDRAMVTREAVLQLTPGEQVLVFENLPEAIESQSIQFTGKGDAIVKDIKIVQIQLPKVPEGRKKELLDKYSALTDSLGTLGDKLNQSASEREFLENITKKVTSYTEKSENAETDPDKWIKMVGYYRTKLNELNNEVRSINKIKRDLQKELESIKKTISDQQIQENTTRKAAEVTVLQKSQGDLTLSLSYIVLGPSWISLYDLRVNSEKKTMTIVYNARITQNTGEDWDACAIQLSTAQPSAGGKQPDLTPWNLSFFQPRYEPPVLSDKSLKKQRAMSNMMPQMMESPAMSAEYEKAEAPIQYETVEVQTKATSVVYAIKGKNSIAGDNQDHKLQIATIDYTAQFRYSTVPKLSPFVYLKAKVTNNSDFMLLAGASSIFLNNNFVGSASLNNVAPGEEFWTFLGIDNTLTVEQKLLKKYDSNEGLFDKKRKTVYEYQIELTNNKKSEEEVVVWDQIPISNNEQIKVALIKPVISEKDSSIKKNEQNFIEWYYRMMPGEKKKIPFSFSVEYPKDQIVSGL
jgi:uncharacterized protein (TIGR02231 family)